MSGIVPAAPQKCPAVFNRVASSMRAKRMKFRSQNRRGKKVIKYRIATRGKLKCNLPILPTAQVQLTLLQVSEQTVLPPRTCRTHEYGIVSNLWLLFKPSK